MNWKKCFWQLAVGLIIAIGIMLSYGLGSVDNTADRVRVISDGFTVVALLYLGIGSLLWISTTGMFDIFGYAVRKGAHALIPGMIHNSFEGYYEYKVAKQEKRKSYTEYSTLILGGLFLVVSVILVIVWSNLS